MRKKLKSLRSTLRRTLVFDEIKNFIIANNLQPGDRLPTEEQITTQLGVSRTAVREAIKAMEALGITEAKIGQGMFVKPFNFDLILQNLVYSIQFDRDDLADVLEVRKALEYFYIGEAIQKISQEEIEQLKGIVRKMEVKAKNGEYLGVEDSRFHQTIFKVVNNDVLLKLLDIFWKLIRNARDETLIVEPDLVGSARRHKKIIEAIKKKDVEAGQKRILEHFTSIEGRIKRAKLKEI